MPSECLLSSDLCSLLIIFFSYRAVVTPLLGHVSLPFSPQKTLMIGDRLDTDILFGKEAGFGTLCVLSGNSSLSLVASADEEMAPDYVATTVSVLQTVAWENDKTETLILNNINFENNSLFDQLSRRKLSFVSFTQSHTVLLIRVRLASCIVCYQVPASLHNGYQEPLPYHLHGSTVLWNPVQWCCAIVDAVTHRHSLYLDVR